MWKWYGKHIFITDVGKHNCIMNYLTNEIPFVSVGDHWKPIRVSSHKPSQNSLTFPDHFVFSPNQETCYRYYYCLNNNVASNLTNHSRSNHNQVVKVACSIVMPQLTLKHLLKWHFIVVHSSVLHGWALISNLKDIASKLNAWHQLMWLKLVLILRYAGAQHKYIFIYSFLSL